MLKERELRTAKNPAPLAPHAAVSPVLRFAPYLLGLFFAAWSLRAVGANNIVDTDAARHAMNGAFIRDLIANGQIMHPIQYGKFYYGHLPALSLPYHPPLFPAIESLFFCIFGVNVLAARLAVALATLFSAVLLYRLILSTHGSHFLAGFVIISFFFCKQAQLTSSDVMLEFPAFVFVLAALYLLKDVIRENARWHWLGFAVLAGASVWTKQHAVFLAVVPFLYIALAGKWRELLRSRLWVASAILGAAVMALSALAVPFHGTGVDQISAVYTPWRILVHNLAYYAATLRTMAGLAPMAFLCGAFLASLFGQTRSKNALYIAWAAAAFGLLLAIVPYEARYLFFVLPPLILLAYDALYRLFAVVAGRKYAWCAPALATLVYCLIGLQFPALYLSGPSEAAAAVVNGEVRRVLYCGSTDGNFVFGVRMLDPKLNTLVIAGDKLPSATLIPAAFESFATRYGINDVVIEQSTRPQACDSLAKTPTASMVLRREITLDSSSPRWKGKLRIYHFTAAAAEPEPGLKLSIPRIGSDVEVKF